MHRFLFYIGMALIAACLHPARTLASVVQPDAKTAHIQPHRAVYKMKLGSAKNGSPVSDVSGTMAFEWKDVCDAWAIQQKLRLRFAYADGYDQEIVSSELTWESKDGKRYNFNVHRTANGQENESYRGKAIKNADDTVSVSYTAPEDKTLNLPEGTLFPTAHTEMVLQKAAEGEKLFSRRVFDGTDEDGATDVSAFISGKREKLKETGSLKLKKNPLLSETPWPVHLAFFKIGTETGEPDYEMDLSLLSNGVVREIKVDYGEFSVVGTLEELKALRPQNCP